MFGLDFFKGQESLTIMDWILRSVVSFVFLLVAAKLMGQRSISQLRFVDFLIAMTLGNVIAHPLSDEKLGLAGSMITTIVLILLYIVATWTGLKWPFFKRYLDPHPLILVKNGQISFRNLSKARISIEHLFSELRKEKAADIRKVSLALWEPGGTISVFMSAPNQSVTPADLNLNPPPFQLHRPIVIDGKIDVSLLREIGKDKEWLEKKTAPYAADLREVRLATVDGSEQVTVHPVPDSAR
ncbi:DUF421 domain-containing protein [Cohnella xylanilytica]|nr:DUF421 domain-containing protein [Cohnella xylanilytica]